MASHEIAMEDIFNFDAFDDGAMNEGGQRVPDANESWHSVPNELPSCNELFPKPDPDIEVNPTTSPESTVGYTLNDGWNEEQISPWLLPPSAFNEYQPPWSAFNLSLERQPLPATGHAFPRITPEPFVQDFSDSHASPSTPSSFCQYPDDVYISSPGADSFTHDSSSNNDFSSLCRTPFPPLPAPRSVPHQRWLEESTGLSSTSFSPWDHVSARFDAATNSFTPPRYLTDPPFLRDGDFGDALSGPIPRTRIPLDSKTAQTTFGEPPSAGYCVSPSQTMHSYPTASPSPSPYPNDPLWPFPDLYFPEQPQPRRSAQRVADIPSTQRPPTMSETPANHPSPLSEDAEDYQAVVQQARDKWGDVSEQDQHIRDAALLDMKSSGLSYKAIKSIGNFPDALPTLRGRYRNLTKPSEERVRRPQWEDEDIQLLCNAVRAQHAKNRNRRHAKIVWKDVAEHMHRSGSSYKFSYVTCSQKWKEMFELRRPAKRTRRVRGQGAYSA